MDTLELPVYTRQPDDQLIYGYLSHADFTPHVPEPSRSASVYSRTELYERMTQLDVNFAGMRKDQVESTGILRRLVPYVMVVRYVDDQLQFAIHQPNDAVATPEFGYALGFSGEVDHYSVAGHLATDDIGVVYPLNVGSSYYSVLQASFRVLDGQAHVVLPSGSTKSFKTEVVPCGFISDYRPDEPGYFGNTRVGIITVMQVDPSVSIELDEEHGVSLGWMSKDDVLLAAGRFDEWSKLCMPLLDRIDERARLETGFAEVEDLPEHPAGE